MKFRIFIPLLLALAAGAGAAQAQPKLLYSYDFERISGGGGETPGQVSTVNHNLAPTPGTGSWTATSGWVGWVNGALGSSYAFNAPAGGAKLTLTGTGENGSLGVNTTDGFTLSFHIRDTGTNIWAKMFQMNTSDGQNIAAGKVTGSTTQAGDSQFSISGTNGYGLGQQNWSAFSAPTDSFIHLAFTFQDGTLTGYQNGVQFITASNLNFTGDLTSINLTPSGGAAFDNVALYSGLLNQSEIAYLSTHAFLPEPATASLCALGLAALAFRRKRRN